MIELKLSCKFLLVKREIADDPWDVSRDLLELPTQSMASEVRWFVHLWDKLASLSEIMRGIKVSLSAVCLPQWVIEGTVHDLLHFLEL